MVIIGFKVFKDKILSGEKRQTIRVAKPYYTRLKPGDPLHLYWKPRTKEMELLHEVPLKRSRLIFWQDFTEELALKDGFSSLVHMQDWFIKTYGEKDAMGQGYMLLEWHDPAWLKEKAENHREWVKTHYKPSELWEQILRVFLHKERKKELMPQGGIARRTYKPPELQRMLSKEVEVVVRTETYSFDYHVIILGDPGDTKKRRFFIARRSEHIPDMWDLWTTREDAMIPWLDPENPYPSFTISDWELDQLKNLAEDEEMIL